MLENLIKLVKEHAGGSIINNPAIPNERNDEAIETTSNSITGGLQNMLRGNGIKDVLRMFGGQEDAINQDNPVVQNVSGNVIQNLMNKFNLDQGSANNIAGGLVPSVLKNLVSRTNNPGDNSFDIQGIFNQLSGGKTGGMDIAGLIAKFKGGLDKDGDGDTDLKDIMAMFSGGGGAGVMDNVKGLFGR